ncbi:MAG: hypothetical protein LBE62_07995 [Azonexus sp.]|jgi:hypothetical protein|nr:hypothetical protein [Azonexus sp.]
MNNPASKQPVNVVLTLGVIVSLLLSAWFFRVCYERYLEFADFGHYYNAASQIVYADAGTAFMRVYIWCLPALGFLLLAIAIVISGFSRSRRQSKTDRGTQST